MGAFVGSRFWLGLMVPILRPDFAVHRLATRQTDFTGARVYLDHFHLDFIAFLEDIGGVLHPLVGEL